MSAFHDSFLGPLITSLPMNEIPSNQQVVALYLGLRSIKSGKWDFNLSTGMWQPAKPLIADKSSMQSAASFALAAAAKEVARVYPVQINVKIDAIKKRILNFYETEYAKRFKMSFGGFKTEHDRNIFIALLKKPFQLPSLDLPSQLPKSKRVVARIAKAASQKSGLSQLEPRQGTSGQSERPKEILTKSQLEDENSVESSSTEEEFLGSESHSEESDNT